MALSHFFHRGNTAWREAEAPAPLPQVAALTNQQLCGNIFSVQWKRLCLVQAPFTREQSINHLALFCTRHRQLKWSFWEKNLQRAKSCFPIDQEPDRAAEQRLELCPVDNQQTQGAVCVRSSRAWQVFTLIENYCLSTQQPQLSVQGLQSKW